MPLDTSALALRERLFSLFERAPDAAPDDDEFDGLARDIFAWQSERNRMLSAWWARRGALPHRIAHWSEIPAVPTAAFKEVPLFAGAASAADLVFRTSGTTRGGHRRGEHYILDRAIYHAALLPAFDTWVLPDGIRPIMISLMPHAHEMPDSSLAHMITVIVERRGVDGSGWYASREHGLDVDALLQGLQRAHETGQPVCLLGTSASFVHAFDAMRRRSTSIALPHGSRLMDTGGFKGVGRSFDADEIRLSAAQLLAIPDAACVNEYGMTEMTSQFYDTSLRRSGPRRKIPPAWVRTRIVDPDSLRPRNDSAPGLLQHFDLANLGSALAVQTEDVGVRVDDGFRVIGRAAGAMPRGCSIAMDELLAATDRGP